MRRIAIGLAVLALVLVGAALAVPFLIPAQKYKALLVQAAERATGRDVRIDGPVSLSILPRLALTASGVVVADAAPGTAGRDLARVGSMDVQVALRPLLGGAVAVERLVLREPQVWIPTELAPAAQGQESRPSAQGQESRPSAGGGGGLPEISLAPVQVADGRMTWTGPGGKVVRQIQDIDATLTMPDLDSPLRLEGSFGYQGRRLTVDATAAEPRRLLEGGASGVTLDLASDVARASFEGRAGRQPVQLSGRIEAEAPDVRELAAWLSAGPRSTTALPFSNARLEGALDVSERAVALKDAVLALDDATARGRVAVALAPARPKVTARLAVGKLDLDRYLPKPTTDSAGGGPPDGKTAAKEGWSQEPIDLTFLQAVDADVRLDLAGLMARDLEVGATTLTTGLAGGRLTTELAQTPILGGSLSGRATVDAVAKVPAFSLDAQAQGVQVEPLLGHLADFRRLTGTGEAAVKLSSRGGSVKAIVSALDGEGQGRVVNGAIKGINLAAMIRNVTSAFQAVGSTEQTDFAELSMTFRVTDGTVATDDLSLQAPLLRVQGRGRVVLSDRRVDMRLEPKVVPTIQGQGGQAAAKGLAVPVLVRGPFDALSFTPDMAGLAEEAIRNPQAVQETIEGVKGAITGQEPPPSSGTTEQQILEGFTKGGSGSSGGGSPVDALKGLLGR
ncbi:MAG TPA: AsmA family protein [Azospirillaceae bacterium]|nr:AsmA family protein [Azospirillaceae bacterium]